MKRAPALQSLSRDHNRALLLARRARRAAASGDEEAVRSSWAELAAAWDDEIADHFGCEERSVIPLLRELGADRLATRLLREHRAIRRTMDRRERWDAERLGFLAAVMHDHVRCEERVAFPLLETRLSGDALASVLAAAGHA